MATHKGGARSGAGRKKGGKNKLTIERLAIGETIRERATSLGITPLEYMLNTLRDEKQSREERMKAAIAAAPYVHARLATIEHKGELAITTHEEALAELEAMAAVGNRALGNLN